VLSLAAGKVREDVIYPITAGDAFRRAETISRPAPLLKSGLRQFVGFLKIRGNAGNGCKPAVWDFGKARCTDCFNGYTGCHMTAFLRQSA
jgi:hypothetical protein